MFTPLNTTNLQQQMDNARSSVNKTPFTKQAMTHLAKKQKKISKTNAPDIDYFLLSITMM